VIGVTSSEGLLAINCCLQDCGKKDEEEWDNVRCYEFDCDIGVLDAGAYVVIELRARLWNSTFLEVSHVTGLQQHVNGHFPGEPGLACSHTHTHPFNGPFSGTTQVGRYQKG